MDGYHLADSELARLRRMGRKGAPDTFDVAGYVALLERLVLDGDEVVYAPAFDRDIEQPIAGSIPVPPTARVIITEGNYLLLNEGEWARVGDCLNEVWYLNLAETERQRQGSDQRNADLVTNTSARADLRVDSNLLAIPRAERGRVLRHEAQVMSEAQVLDIPHPGLI